MGGRPVSDAFEMLQSKTKVEKWNREKRIICKNRSRPVFASFPMFLIMLITNMPFIFMGDPRKTERISLKNLTFSLLCCMGVDACLRYKMIDCVFCTYVGISKSLPMPPVHFHPLVCSGAARSDFCSSWQCAVILHLDICWIFA